MMKNEGEATPSVDVFRRRLSAGTPKFGLPFALHVALAGWLLYSLLTRRWGPSMFEQLFAWSLTSALCWIGILTLAVTAALGLRVAKESTIERWRWPVVVPTLVLVVLQMTVFSRGTALVSAAGDAAAQLGGGLFTLSALALSSVAGIARVGFAFAACGLSLTGWILATSAQRDTANAPATLPFLPAALAVAATATGFLFASFESASLLLIIGALGVIPLFRARAAGATPTALRDVFAAGLCLAGACVLAGLHHFNQTLSLADPSGSDIVETAQQLAASIERAREALSAAWLVAFGYLLGAGFAVYIRRGAAVGALKRSIPLLIAVLLCFAMPWAGARVQLSQAVSKLEAASGAVIPATVDLPELQAESGAQGWLGEPWLLGPSEVAVGASKAALPTATLVGAECRTFATAVLASAPLGHAAGAIDRSVGYERAYCVLGALAEEWRSQTGQDFAAIVLGKGTSSRPLPALFKNVVLPPAGVRVFPNARDWEAEKVRFVHVDASGKYYLDQTPAAISLEALVSRLEPAADAYDEANVVALTADPKAEWEDVFALAARMPRHSVVLGPPNTHGKRWSPPSDPNSGGDADREPSPGGDGGDEE